MFIYALRRFNLLHDKGIDKLKRNFSKFNEIFYNNFKKFLCYCFYGLFYLFFLLFI